MAIKQCICLVFGSALLAACAGDKGGTPAPSATSTSSAPATLPDETCVGDTRAPMFYAGIPFSGSSGVTVKVTDSSPAPPKVGDNTWTVEIDDMTGVPISGAKIIFSQRMIDHGHPGSKNPVITEMGNGIYKLAPVNMYMPGYWENYFEVKTDALDAKVTVKVCVEN